MNAQSAISSAARVPDCDKLALAATFLECARSILDRYALATDGPDWRVVEAADALDNARGLLAMAARHV